MNHLGINVGVGNQRAFLHGKIRRRKRAGGVGGEAAVLSYYLSRRKASGLFFGSLVVLKEK